MPTEYTAVRWKCQRCTTATQTRIDKGHVFVPFCHSCHKKDNRHRYRCVEGDFLTEVDGALVLAEPEAPELSITDGKHLARQILASDLWDIFTALLDASTVRMGDGSASREMCRACENRAHFDVTAPCTCVCHRAWAMKDQVEAKVEDAA